MKKKLLSIFVVLAMVVAMLPALTMTVFAETQSIGGSGITWELSNENTVLTIGGTGAMPDFGYPDYSPWYDDYKNTITTVIIEFGVTSIGNYSFYECNKLTSVTIPDSVATIGECAFNSCTALKSITIPDLVATIGECAFENCSSLEIVNVKATTSPTLGFGAFYRCNNLSKIYVPAASVDTYKSAWSQYADKIVAFHDLKVTKNGEAAVEGTDYQWDENNKQLTIITDGLTVSGSTTSEIIVTGSNVRNLTIKDLSIKMESYIDDDSPFLIELNETNMILTLVGENLFENNVNFGDCVSFPSLAGVNHKITGEGSLTVLSESDTAIYSYADLAIEDGIGKILVRGSNDNGAFFCKGDVTLGDELLAKGSTAFNADEANITDDIEFVNNCYKTKNGVAKSVLIQPKKYDVKVATDIKNGKIKEDKEKAAKGETVTLTVTPNECYKLALLKVTDADGEEVTVTNNKFEMPASNVTVTAKFETVEYKMKKGEKQEIDLTDVKDAVFTSEAEFSKFKSVKVDDKTVDSKNYTVKEGSTVVTLKADYLKTLKLGKHEIKILSDDGMATTEFTVIKTTPKTADANNMLLWIVLALAAISLTTCTVFRVKRTNK